MRYSENGVVKDVLAILKDHGFNSIRLRVFNDPTKATPRDRPYSPQGYCDLPHTIAMGQRVKKAGMRLLIDFHYSDAWADPDKQYTPSAWAGLSFEDLVKKMHDWTKVTVTQMKEAGAPANASTRRFELSTTQTRPVGLIATPRGELKLLCVTPETEEVK